MIQLHFKKYGDEGKPLIILHGFLGSLDNWHTLSTLWSKNGIAVYAVDLRNHGRSPHTEHHSIDLMVDDLKDFMNEHHLSSATILGHSMGGKVAMQFALTFPEMVDKLIVADIAPKKYKPGHDNVFKAIFNVDLDSIKTRKEAEEAMISFLPDFGTRQFILKNMERNDEGKYSWKFNLETLFKEYDEVTKEIQPENTFSGETLFIRGGLSKYIRDNDIETIKNIFPNSRIVTIENAGHWLHADKPEDFSKLVLDFLLT